MKKTVGRQMLVWLALGTLLSGCASQRSAVAYEPIPNSSVIDAKVQRLLAGDPLLKGHNIKVNTFQGQVKLDGIVETEEQRQQVTKLAWGVSGVREVENNLVLRSERH
jgi:osmotically-inducible protein OsmY